ncbi:MAG: hypothetical protein K2X66_03705, partial [Cyanobacteria bacterium]|nr:hypothetical protein [Cyanobacteriota bacterium]
YASPRIVAETAGPNGVTENALASLNQLIIQLEKTHFPPDTVASLKELSKRGYGIQKAQLAYQNYLAKASPETLNVLSLGTRYYAEADKKKIPPLLFEKNIPIPGESSISYFELLDRLGNFPSLMKRDTNGKLNIEVSKQQVHDRLENWYQEMSHQNFTDEQQYSKSSFNLFTNQLMRLQQDDTLKQNPAILDFVTNVLAKDVMQSSIWSGTSSQPNDLQAFSEITENRSTQICHSGRAVECH